MWCSLFDHHAQNCFLLSSGFPETKPALRAHRARQRRDWLFRKLAGIPAAPAHEPLSFPALETPPQSPLSAEDYQSRVQKIIDYIYAGDIFQANLAHRFTAKLNAQDNAFAFYKRLRHVSAAPFAGFSSSVIGRWLLPRQNGFYLVIRKWLKRVRLKAPVRARKTRKRIKH